MSITGTPLTGATDTEGRYTITGLPAGTYGVRIRAIGYRSMLVSRSVASSEVITLDVTLQPSAVTLEEVVVAGAGAEMERKRLGNTVATIHAADVLDAPVRTISEVLAAREPGVALLPSSGLAAEGARIRIRGNASLYQSNEPVVYVDGVRVDNGGGFGFITAGSTTLGGGGTASRLDDINPDQIERIEILKGAAAATLYGSEASAGVIHIYTKKGMPGRPNLVFQVEQGFTRYPTDRIEPQAGFPRTQGRADTLQGIMRGFATTEDGGPIAPWKVFSIPSVTRYFGTGYAPAYSAGLNGGTPDVLYNLAGRYASELGPFDTDRDLGPGSRSFDRRSQASMNLTFFPRHRVSLAPGVRYTGSRHLAPPNANNTTGLLTNLYFSRPETASCVQSIKRGLGGAFGEDPSHPGSCAGPGNEWGSVALGGDGTVRENAQEEIGQEAQHFNGTLRVQFEPPVQRLKVDGTLGVDVTDTRDFDRIPWGRNVDSLATARNDGQVSFGSIYHRQLTADIRANWSADFGSSVTADVTIGSQGTSGLQHLRWARGVGLPGPDIIVTGAGTTQLTRESFAETTNIGMLGQAQLGYQRWAYLTIGTRWDRNSAFGESVAGKAYPKASISLVVSDMPGWRVAAVPTLRLRGAFGKSGLHPGPYDRFTTFAPLSSQLGTGLGPENLGNADLRPEVSREFELGAEIGLLADRLGVEVTYWDRETRDALVPTLPLPSGGFWSLRLANIGALAAHGWDVKLTATMIDRPSFGLDVFANGAYLSQRVADMGGAPAIKVGDTYTRYRNSLVEGYAPGSLFGVQILQPCGRTQHSVCLPNADHYPYDTNGDGQPDTRAELLAYLAVPRLLNQFNAGFRSPTATQAPIGPLLDDNDGDGVFDDHFLGKPTPDWQGAFGADARFGRHWSFRALVEYKAGNYQVSNLTQAFRNNHPQLGRNSIAIARLQRDLENPASTPEVRLQALVDYAAKYKELNPYNGLHLAETGDFLRLREIGVSYRAPQSIAAMIGVRDIVVSLTGRNLALWTAYGGADPEVNGTSRAGGRGTLENYLDSVDAWGFPLPRRLTISMRFGL